MTARGRHDGIMRVFQNLHPVKAVRVTLDGGAQGCPEGHPEFRADVELADAGARGQRRAAAIGTPEPP
jgi:hypothetical protein